MALIECTSSVKGVTTLTLNDPDNRNAMSEAMADEFASAAARLCSDPSLRVLVIRGAGAAFSGGGHLDMLFEKTKISTDENRERMKDFYFKFLSLLDIPVPVVAAVNGHAIGAGLCLALACDMRIVSTDAKLGLNFVKLGLHPGMGATYFLPRLVGPAKASELLYLGKILGASEAQDIGLVNHAISPASFDAFLDETVQSLSQSGPLAIRHLKESLRESDRRTLAECLEQEAQTQALNYAGPEFLEGISAAKEKRVPRF